MTDEKISKGTELQEDIRKIDSLLYNAEKIAQGKYETLEISPFSLHDETIVCALGEVIAQFLILAKADLEGQFEDL